MAGRLKYRKILKHVHLFSGMILLAYLLMYFFTAFVMIRHDWFHHSEPKVSLEKVPFEIDRIKTDFTKLQKTIKKELKITGREDEPFQRKDSCWIYNIYKPGLSYNIVLNQSQDSLTIKRTEQLNLARVSSRLHLMRHYKGGIKYYIWTFIYDLAAISMLLFAITGLLIWLKMNRKYRAGLYFLVIGFLFSFGVLGYLLWF